MLGAVLREGESVEALCAGRVRGARGVAALTDRRVLVVDDGPWKPTVLSFDLGPDLAVRHLGDERASSLALTRGTRTETVDRITDPHLARELADAVRSAGDAPTGA